MNETHFGDDIPVETVDNTNGFPYPTLTFAGVLTFIIMIVGILGNSLTLAALIKCPKVRNVAAAFIISLCLADLLFCALVLPFMGLRFLQGTWTHGDVLCQLIPFIQYGNIGVSLLCIAMITINRYIMIAHHGSYGKIYKKHWIAAMIAFCWIFSYGMQLPTLFGIWGTFGYDPKLATCSILNDKDGHSSKTTLFIIAFIIPCIIIIACYTKIFWVVHSSEMRMKRHACQQNSIPNNLRPTPMSSADNDLNRISSNLASDSSFSTDGKQEGQPKSSSVKDKRELRAKRNEWRITKMVLAIFLSFVVCYLPITIAKVADKEVDHLYFHIFSYIMLYLSACINPIIYVIMNKQYRKAYKTVIMCKPNDLLPFKKAVTVGGSVADMERYRIEQQPEPHNSVANFGRRTPNYQLQPLASTTNFFGSDYQGNVKEPRRMLECNASTENYNDNLNNTEQQQRTRLHAEDEQGAESNSINGGRYNPGRRGRSIPNVTVQYVKNGGDNTRERESCAEENPILWTKHKKHSNIEKYDITNTSDRRQSQ